MIREPVCFLRTENCFWYIGSQLTVYKPSVSRRECKEKRIRDGIFVGKYLGENALAGVAAAVSGVLTIILAKTMKLEAQSGKNE